MTTWNKIKELGANLPETEENDHIGTPAIRVNGKIFVQLSAEDSGLMLIKLSKSRQEGLLKEDALTFSAPKHWGKFGWTSVKLKRISVQAAKNLLEESWIQVAPKKLSKQFLNA